MQLTFFIMVNRMEHNTPIVKMYEAIEGYTTN